MSGCRGGTEEAKAARTAVMAAALILALAWGSLSLAADDDDDGPMPRASVKGAPKSRAYLGSRDEQELKVQVVLPQPSRFPENASAAEKGQLGGEPSEND